MTSAAAAASSLPPPFLASPLPAARPPNPLAEAVPLARRESTSEVEEVVIREQEDEKSRPSDTSDSSSTPLTPKSAKKQQRPVFLYQELGPQRSPQLIPALLASSTGSPRTAGGGTGSHLASPRKNAFGLPVIASVPGLAASLLAATFVETMSPSPRKP